ncbi:MAG: MFS transporter [Alphaproteobacteria bacterium]|nr:MFS transporter [Alphaproteobacteria bacterium]
MVLKHSQSAGRSGFAAVLATGIAFFMVVLDTSIVNLALPRIAYTFQAGLTTLQWLVDGYALVFASLLLGAGALGDRYDAKRVFVAGLVVFSAASAACGLAPGIASLQCARIVQGIGAAMLLPNSLAALNHTITERNRRTAAVSAWASAGALGIALGPVLGGVLVQWLDWRSIFLVNVPVGLIGVWLSRRHISGGPVQSHRALDPFGQILAVATLAGLTYWLIGVRHWHLLSPTALLLGLGSLLLGAAFLAVESRQQRPMLPLDLLVQPKLGWVALVGLLHNVGIYGLIFVLSLSFQQLRGMTPLAAGLLFVPLTLTLAVGTRVGARVLRHSGPSGPLVWGHGTAALGAGALTAIGLGHGSMAILLPLCAIGTGAGVTTPSMSLMVLDAVERERSGLASGILNSARQIGGVIGVALLGVLLGEPASAHGARSAALAATIALACASVLAVGIARRYHAPMKKAAALG